ncbi:MAG: type II secretion system F family protein [Christensenellales bacterium]
MAIYYYNALNADGAKVKGSLEADGLDSFRQEIKRMGFYLLTYSTENENVGQALSGSIKTKELSIICRQFSTMLSAGIGVVKSLEILADQTNKARTRNILLAVMEDVRKGSSLYQAMAKQGRAFPFYLISSVETGETSGTLDSVMERMADYFEKQYKIAARVKSALIYPIILAMLCLIVLTMMLIFVVPQFVKMFEAQSAELPAMTKMLISISDFFTEKWWLLLAIVAAIAGVITIIKSIGKTRIMWDRAMLNIPIIGKMRRVLVTSKFAHTLSTLTSSGISMLIALEVVSRVINNASISKIIEQIIDDLKRGISLSASIQKFEVFPPMFRSMIAVGEQTGEMDALLLKTALFYDDEADNAIKQMVALIEPLMIVIMALIIGFIVIAIILPIYQIYDYLG